MLGFLIVNYERLAFPFQQIVESHVGYELSQLHQRYRFERLARGTEQHTALHRHLYSIGPDFFSLYHRFLHEVVTPLVGEPIIYQQKPNFRVQLPGNVAVRGYHRDRDDHHLRTGINFWVPLTPVSRHTAVWIETWEGSGRYRPACAQPGQVLVFDGANLSHGNRTNESTRTRLSFDFRVVPASLFESSSDRSMYKGVRFALGEYFERLSPAASSGRQLATPGQSFDERPDR
jgi:ectoine hydroxylase-related dioxygenase (phytanoyl-CoA dioxygenase family)